mmetsp:Transcript_96416/g.241730  ORF Transcript_96416/g.241730 Transcript_96416/m.241730 type:complete len:247 (+) Transcript_96416:121-861(+)|eukprot:CAMPEP_0115213282 /NCGR_PEP_ID=MMETSP0270-20121206/23714_1 /TAXON_ID=71861 /ORGANISM="Scrippsiella trochoidea, Strain CCMP3099" /LENGTH=246 /DNA_ID=CAMNT_0002627027 /DNA_START=110 /DNA_END=850 /DNA_ORIENTATION=+
MVFGRLMKKGSRQGDEEMYKVNSKGEKDEDESLLNSASSVLAYKQSANTVTAERVRPDAELNLGVEAFAMWPTEVEIQVPADYQAGQVIAVQGPTGLANMILPSEAQPGTSFRYKIKAAPEYRVEVPAGATPGASVSFDRADGARISIVVPPGLKPGNCFEVTPPALMVLTPEGLQPGDYVLINPAKIPGMTTAGEEPELFRVQIPEELQLGRYFAARLPEPKVVKKPSSRGLGIFKRREQEGVLE